jgi:hypothetical protein
MMVHTIPSRPVAHSLLQCLIVNLYLHNQSQNPQGDQAEIIKHPITIFS